MTSYLQCGGRLGTHTGFTGWSESLRTCTRAVCTGLHPSLSGHRILGVVSRFKRLDQDVEQGQPSIVIHVRGRNPSSPKRRTLSTRAHLRARSPCHPRRPLAPGWRRTWRTKPRTAKTFLRQPLARWKNSSTRRLGPAPSRSLAGGERGEHARADGVSDRNETAVENVCRMLLYLQLTRYCTVQYVEAPTEQG